MLSKEAKLILSLFACLIALLLLDIITDFSTEILIIISITYVIIELYKYYKSKKE